MKVLCVSLQKPSPGTALKLAEIFYRYSSQVALRANEAIFVEIEKSQRLYRPETLRARAQAILKRLNVAGRVVLADDAATALALARFPTATKETLPLEALLFYASPFAADPEVEKKIFKTLHVLERLGLKQVPDLLQLSVRHVLRHLGADGYFLTEKIRRAPELVWPKFVPPEKIVEGLTLDEKSHAGGDLEGIVFLLKGLLDRLTLRLKGRGERLQKFKLVLELERHSHSSGHRQIDFQLTFPQANAKHLLTIVRERLSQELQRTPLDALIEDLRVEVTETAPYQTAQKNLFHPKKEEQEEAWHTLVSRISQKLGREKVFMAELKESYRPEGSWQRTTQFASDMEIKKTEEVARQKLIAERFPDRPLRLLKEPIRVGAEWLKRARLSEEIEVLSGEWWRTGFERIYFRALGPQGENFWLYKSQDGYFIHGLFD